MNGERGVASGLIKLRAAACRGEPEEVDEVAGVKGTVQVPANRKVARSPNPAVATTAPVMQSKALSSAPFSPVHHR